jgi:hypothetical protein
VKDLSNYRKAYEFLDNKLKDLEKQFENCSLIDFIVLKTKLFKDYYF